MLEGAARRASLLQELTIAVANAADADAAARVIVGSGRELLDAISSVVWLVDADGALQLVASAGVPEAFLVAWRTIRPEDDVPAMHALRAGEPLWVGSADDYRKVDEQIADRATRANRPMAFAAVPLRFEARALGVIVFGFAAPHAFADGEKHLILAVSGHAAQALERARLQVAQVRALTALRIVAKAGEILSASLDMNATLTSFARAVVPDIADWCAIDMVVDGKIRRLTAQHVDANKVAIARAYAESYPSKLGDPNDFIARVIATGETVWVRRITAEMIAGAIGDERRRAVLLSLGLRSVVQVPLASEGRICGVVSFFMAESGREYDEGDRDVLVEIGRRAGLALANAALYAREQKARDRITRIQLVTAALARATTSSDVGCVACREGAAALGATVASLYTVDGDRLRLAGHHGFPDDLMAQHRELPLARDAPLARVVRQNKPLAVESRAALLHEFPALEGPLAHFIEAQAFLGKPLADRSGRIVGALGFGFSEARTFTDDDRAFARTLAEHCAQAFERARILDLERKARERLAILAAAGESLSTTIEYEETLRAVVGVALPALADFGFFDVVEGEVVRRTSAAHDDPEVAAILAQSKWVRSERTDVNLCALSSRASALHPHIDDAFLRDMATSDGHLEVLRKLRLCSMITVPVVSRGAIIGALTLCYGASGRHHTNDDLELAEELARRGALAVEHARLYRTTREAATRAEEANRVKDDFLATVSHELRTPLNAIVGWAHLLEGDRLGDIGFVERGIDVIRRNANAQREIIDDILDVSRIVSGKLRLDAAPLDLTEIARDALEVVRPAADAKGVRLDTGRFDAPALHIGDGARLQQVIWNLLANAVKFTPGGGTVTVDVISEGATITLRVSDDGQGIAPEFLPRVFERFQQADTSATRTHGGLGLGLSIVRHLVELHGGTVSAASGGRGLGSTFEVRLPLRAGTTPPPRRHSSSSPAASLEATEPLPLHGRSVLVVDDDRDSRELVGELLRIAGATVCLTDGADAATAAFSDTPPDVVVTDIAMPDIDGYALLGILKKIAESRKLTLRAVALTAYGRAEDRAAAARAGFLAHVPKPVEPTALVSTLSRILFIS